MSQMVSPASASPFAPAVPVDSAPHLPDFQERSPIPLLNNF